MSRPCTVLPIASTRACGERSTSSSSRRRSAGVYGGTCASQTASTSGVRRNVSSFRVSSHETAAGSRCVEGDLVAGAEVGAGGGDRQAGGDAGGAGGHRCGGVAGDVGAQAEAERVGGAGG